MKSILLAAAVIALLHSVAKADEKAEQVVRLADRIAALKSVAQFPSVVQVRFDKVKDIPDPNRVQARFVAAAELPNNQEFQGRYTLFSG